MGIFSLVRDTDDNVGIVFPGNFQCEGARELAEQRPLHMQNTL